MVEDERPPSPPPQIIDYVSVPRRRGRPILALFLGCVGVASLLFGVLAFVFAIGEGVYAAEGGAGALACIGMGAVMSVCAGLECCKAARRANAGAT